MIDAHVHLWDPAARERAGATLAPLRRAYTVDELRRHAAAAGVARAILVQTVGDVAETEQFLATAASSGGLIGGVVGWTDLASPSIADDVARLRGRPGGDLLVGIRHQVEDEPSAAWLLGDDVARGIASVGAAGLVYDLLVRGGGLDVCAAVADAHPGVRFVLDHAGKPSIAGGGLDTWRRELAELARRDHVAVKLSGLVTEAAWDSWTVDDLAPVAEHVLDSFGPSRVMFGSDWPVCELAASYDDVVDAAARLLAALSSDERTDVLERTAARVYGL